MTVSIPAGTPRAKLVMLPFSSIQATAPITNTEMPQTICWHTTDVEKQIRLI